MEATTLGSRFRGSDEEKRREYPSFPRKRESSVVRFQTVLFCVLEQQMKWMFAMEMQRKGTRILDLAFRRIPSPGS